MRICIIASHFLPTKTGVSLHLNNLLKNFSKLGMEVLFLSPDCSIAIDSFPNYRDYIGEIYPHVKVVSVPSAREDGRPELVQFQHHSQWMLDDYIGPFAPEIIQVDEPEHIYGLKLFGLRRSASYEDSIGVGYARKMDIPIVAFYHTHNAYIAECRVPPGIPTEYRLNPKAVFQNTYGAYQKVFCASDDARGFLVKHGLDNVKCGNYIGIDDDFLSVGLSPSRLQNNGDINLIYTGRFFSKSDVETLLRVYTLAREKYPRLFLYIAGVERWQEALDGMWPAGDNGVKYLGFLDHTELAKAYAASHIFLSPFKIDTLGLSTIEAMAAGLPCIVVDKGGARNIIKNGVNGYRCATDAEFADAIIKVIKEREYTGGMSQRAMEEAKKYLSSVCTMNILQEYEALVRKRQTITKSSDECCS